MKAIYKIKGMSCSSCVLKIESILKDISGVSHVSVNLPLENVAIEYDDSISPTLFKSILKKSGFELIIDAEQKKSIVSDSEQSLKFKLILTLFFGLPLFIFSMYEMMNEIKISNFSLIFQFIFTTIIMIIGREFHIIGFNAILRLKPDMNSLIFIGTSAAYFYSIISSINLYYNFKINGF